MKKQEPLFSSQNDLEFLQAAYKIILGRAPDKGGLDNYLARLSQGTPRFRVLLDIITSPEAKFRGFDSTDIEDVIVFYKKVKKNIPRPILDQLIARKYSDRIHNFFRKISLAYQRDTRQSNMDSPDSPASPISSAHPTDDKSYAATRDRAEALLEKIYTNRRMAPRDSILDDALGIHVPRWVGVTNSTKSFFPHTFPIPFSAKDAPEHLNDDQIRAFTDVLVDAAFSQLIFSGGDYNHYRIAKSIKERAPRKRIKVIWHGSPRQLGPHYELDPFIAWISATRAGICDSIGTVKPGMIRLFEALGVRAYYLRNSVDLEPSTKHARTRPDTVGMWLSHVGNYNKPVVPTLFALSHAKDISLQGSGFGEDGIQLIQRLGIRHKSIFPYTIPHAKVIDGMRTSKLTIYVTLSECMPMVPFESIAVGTPCLVGPSTRLYDDPFLEERLVVRNPFDPFEILKKIEQALSDYDKLITASTEFLLRSRELSTKGLLEFLS